MPSYKRAVFTSKSKKDNNLVTVSLKQLFARPDQVLSQDDTLVIELKCGRQVCPTHFRVNRADVTTAATKSWPGVLAMPMTGQPVQVECRVLSIAPPAQSELPIEDRWPLLSLGC